MSEPRSNNQEEFTNGGAIHISEDVIAELARKTIQGIQNIKVDSKLPSRFSIGRRSGGIRVSVEHKQGTIAVDANILVKYGQRIPDLAWDVQEKIKDNLERYTGYDVKAVNVNVQGIYTGSGDEFRMNIAASDSETPDPNDEAD